MRAESSAAMRTRAVGRWIRQYGVITILIVLALVTTIFYARQENEIREQAHCQATFNEQFRLTITQRAKYTDADRRNMVQLVRDITTARTPDAYSKALQRYIRVSDGIDADRREHPYPKLSQRCGQ